MTNDSPMPSERTNNRILCVTSNFPRWRDDSTTPFVLNLAKDLQELGWRVDILAPHAEQGTASVETLDGVHIERFSYLWPQRLQSICYHGGALVNLRRDKSNLLKIPLFVAAEWLALIKRLATGNYDLLHSHWILPQGFTGVLAAKPLGIPHVTTVHGGDVFALQGPLTRPFKRFSLQNVDAVTVNSSATQNEVQKIAYRLNNLQKIPMGVTVDSVDADDPRIRNLQQKFRRNAGPLLIFAGRVVKEKGIEDILEATRHLKAICPDTTALIVGDGQDRKQLEETTSALGLEDRVKFTGWIKPEEIPIYLAAGDIFVGPSRQSRDGWIEAQGLTFIEAMISRTPVVATRSGGIVDSVIHEQTGLLVDERAPEQIADAAYRLMSDLKLRTHIVDSAFTLASDHFSRAASAQAFSSLFSSVLRDRSSKVAQ